MRGEKKLVLALTAEAMVPPFEVSGELGTMGLSLQEVVLRGFATEDTAKNRDVACKFTKEFTLREHGEFFRGVALGAPINHAPRFYEFLKSHGRVRVTVRREDGV